MAGNRQREGISQPVRGGRRERRGIFRRLEELGLARRVALRQALIISSNGSTVPAFGWPSGCGGGGFLASDRRRPSARNRPGRRNGKAGGRDAIAYAA